MRIGETLQTANAYYSDYFYFKSEFCNLVQIIDVVDEETEVQIGEEPYRGLVQNWKSVNTEHKPAAPEI